MTEKEYKEYCERIREQARTEMEGKKSSGGTYINMAFVRKKGIELYLELQSERKIYEGIIAAIDERKSIYAPECRDKLKNQATADFEEKAIELCKEFTNTVTAAIANKKKNLNEMITTPPTQEQVNLLTSLQMRRKNLEKSEILHLAPMLVGNYNAFKTLQVIALESGFKLTVPVSLDYERLGKAVEWSEKYLNERITDFTLPWRQMSPVGRCFFGAEWEDLMYLEQAVQVLDENAQMNAPTPDIYKRELTESENLILERLFDGYSPDNLKIQINEAAKSDELKSLIVLHPEYSKYLVEEDNEEDGDENEV